ncbi:hypothetical protein [Aeribacillus pallidus]|uniref:hypothetical protein n=1 Tax=Aeribacillus pallidus TaxID=33936 RepID=UPI000E352D08|nr:hypothetical protein [Aeribacillus pallidus]
MKTFFQGLTFPDLAQAGKEQAKRAAKGHDDERIQETNHQQLKLLHLLAAVAGFRQSFLEQRNFLIYRRLMSGLFLVLL